MEHVYGIGVAPGLRPARPGRTPVVAPDLAELRGPTHGVVELPQRLLWARDPRVDLDQPGGLEWMYALILREAVSPVELTRFLDGPTLARIWKRLYLPSGLRESWQARHPELAA
jgi:hypothetical protein